MSGPNTQRWTSSLRSSTQFRVCVSFGFTEKMGWWISIALAIGHLAFPGEHQTTRACFWTVRHVLFCLQKGVRILSVYLLYKKKRWNYPKYGFNYINVFDTQSNIFPVCGVHRTLYTPSHFHRINAKCFFGLFFLSRIFRTTLFDFVGHKNLCGRPDPAPRPRVWHQALKDRKEVDREHLFVCFLNSEDKRY